MDGRSVGRSDGQRENRIPSHKHSLRGGGIIRVDELGVGKFGVDKMGEDKMGVDKMGSRRSRMKPFI